MCKKTVDFAGEKRSLAPVIIRGIIITIGTATAGGADMCSLYQTPQLSMYPTNMYHDCSASQYRLSGSNRIVQVVTHYILQDSSHPFSIST